MTRDECKTGLQRLAEGFEVSLPTPRIDAYFESFKHVDPDDWREAVTTLLTRDRFPRDIEVMLEVIDRHAEQRRKRSQALDKKHSEAFFAGRTRTARDSMEQAYGSFRARLLGQAMGNGPTELARVVARGLREWLEDPEHEAWSCQVVVRDCGHPGAPHKLFTCLDAEIGHYEVLAQREAVPA